MIYISENAAKQIAHLKSQEPDKDSFLRVQIVGGGCSGLSYKLQFENTGKKENDKVFEEHGVKVVVDSKSYLYLLGTTLDYEGGLNGKGFSFQNPNAKKSCGCGSSFSV
jgi:iron-sulfur cluster assembly protein